MKPVNDVIGGLGTTIFTVMSALSVEHGAINLGQGFPDEDGPADVREAAARAAIDGPNQYPPMMGLPALRQAVAAHNRRFYGLDVDWQSQVLVTSGATEALTASLLALLRPGDEVVLIEPVYDSYLPIVQLAGAADLIGAVAKAHQFITFTTPPSLQGAVAHGLGKEDAYFDGLASAMERKRDRLVAGLRDVGFRPLWNEGTDVDFAMKLVREARVGSIPVSAFYPENPPTHLVRFCFCKRDAVLDEAIARLRAFAGKNG